MSNNQAAVLSCTSTIDQPRVLSESLDWRLGQRYWQARGSQSFLADAAPVPYTINNDGNLSGNAARLLLAALSQAESAGALRESINVLELGIGVGIFARLFLDAFRSLCALANKDYYDRLLYVCGDFSPRMLEDAARNGIFANHPGRYQFREVNALAPMAAFPENPDTGPRPFSAMFLNYVLDCLPTTVLDVAQSLSKKGSDPLHYPMFSVQSGEDTQDWARGQTPFRTDSQSEVRELRVRCRLARGIRLEDYTQLSAETLAECAASGRPEDEQELLKVFGILRSEYCYEPVDPAAIPYGPFAVDFIRGKASQVLLNHGAIRALEQLVELLGPHGFILVNDYGPTELAGGDVFEHQRFSNATSIGLNFPLLRAYFGDAGRARWVEPAQENEHIHARLLGRELADGVVQTFQELFGKSHWEWTRKPAADARQAVQFGRLETAARLYEQALVREPLNWMLKQEVAQFLLHYLREVKDARDLVRLALELNPLSSEAWNVLADCEYELGRMPEARQAYERAARINEADVRSRQGLAWVEAHAGNYAASLQRLAEGLALDGAGVYRQGLLRKQAEVLELSARRHQQEARGMVDRIISDRLPGGRTPAVENAKPTETAKPAAESGKV